MRKQLEEFITNAIEFERTIKLVSNSQNTGLKAYHHVTLKRLVKVRGIEFEDDSVTIECEMEYQTPGYLPYVDTHRIEVHLDELNDFKVYKDLAKLKARTLNSRELKARERDREDLEQRELAELKRLQEKYNR
jgi:hypothetical protein